MALQGLKGIFIIHFKDTFSQIRETVVGPGLLLFTDSRIYLAVLEMQPNSPYPYHEMFSLLCMCWSTNAIEQ